MYLFKEIYFLGRTLLILFNPLCNKYYLCSDLYLYPVDYPLLNIYRLDGKHVVFGQVDADCMSVIQAIEAVGSANGKTKETVTITNSGEL